MLGKHGRERACLTHAVVVVEIEDDGNSGLDVDGLYHHWRSRIGVDLVGVAKMRARVDVGVR